MGGSSRADVLDSYLPRQLLLGILPEEECHSAGCSRDPLGVGPAAQQGLREERSAITVAAIVGNLANNARICGSNASTADPARRRS